MNGSSLHPLARDYLKRLKKAARHLPRARRRELLGEIEAHLSEALPAGASEAEAQNVLERLGEPEQIAAEAESGSGERAGTREWLAIPLLLFGGFALMIGWCVGFALLWSSRIWTTRDKLIGTFVVPGGLATVFVLAGFALSSSSSGSGGVVVTCTRKVGGEKCTKVAGSVVSHSGHSNVWGMALLIALLVLPFLTSAYLTWRANRLTTATS
ncbi:MAG: DUF1700 domain-containing protein [Gaiellaceae bacterium]